MFRSFGAKCLLIVPVRDEQAGPSIRADSLHVREASIYAREVAVREAEASVQAREAAVQEAERILYAKQATFRSLRKKWVVCGSRTGSSV